MKKIPSFTVLALLALVSTLGWGADFNWEENRLIPLQKITVGPWDNFEATITADDKAIYFTRTRTQIPTIYYQDLNSNEANLFIGEEGDAKDPVLNASGRYLAITYYKYDAQGDVCLVKLPNKDIDCITSTQTVDESPFWIDVDHLGYLSRDTSQIDRDLISYDLQTKQKKVLHRGLISSPAATPDGRYILFNQSKEGEVHQHLYDRQTATLHDLVGFDLSGITGFMAFSKDGRYLYFNHYLNDTNGDQVIDGNDNSVAFRVPFDQWMKATKPLLPEQLTSVENNCKFPAVTQTHLYLTCAFEGSLDIYRLPLSGAVPPEWNEKQLWEAHLVARSHEDRLLILNTLRYRFHLNHTAMLERLLSNHLEIGELTASIYYIKQLETLYRDTGNQRLVNFYQVLQQYLHVRSSKQRVPVGIVTARFQHIVSEARQQIHTIQGWPQLETLMDGYLEYELENYNKASASLKHIDLASSMLPLERYLAFELYRRLYEEKDPQRLLGYYPLMFNDTTLSLEARIYYAFNYLKLLGRVQTDVSVRINTIEEQAKRSTHPKIAELFSAEIMSLKLATSHDQKQQAADFKVLTDLLKENRNDLLVRKALHTRAIQILGEAEQFQYMELLSRHWLVTTQVSEMEFVNVAEQYSIITMDKAYGMMAQGDLAKAYSTFYSAIRQTNDLEAHYQFITLGLTPNLNKRDNLEKSYQILEKQHLLGQNKNYVQALQLLIENEQKGGDQTKALDQALTLLKAMRVQGLSPAMRDLLMGYIYHEKLLASEQGYRYDKALFQKAHYHYMMALDLGRENSRITASVWENVAWLHFEVRQYALSVDFFRARFKLPFTSPEAEANARWAFARSLFYNNELEEAQQQAESALALAHKSKTLNPAPFLEKTAFYAMQAGDEKHAAAYYEELFSSKAPLPDDARAKGLLGYGYALMQLGEHDKAAQQMQQVLDLSRRLKPLPSNATRLLPFQPERLQLLAYGFLAELTIDPNQRADYRYQRTLIWQQMAGRSKEFAYDEAGRLSFLTKDYQHMAVAYEKAGHLDKAADAMDQSLLSANAWSKETGDEIGPVIYRTLVNYLSLGLAHPQAFKDHNVNALTTSCQRVLKAFSQQSFRTATIVMQQAKLTILWEAYRSRVLGQETGTLDQRLRSVMDNPEVKQLQVSRTEDYQELQALVLYFK